MTCQKCGSDALITGVRIFDRSGAAGQLQTDLTTGLYKDPHAVIFKEEVSTPIYGRVCGSCGYLELYATEPAKLLAAAREVTGR